ncbi:hypothetical protein OHC33_003314 [Knufia fluminis]|uniref:Tetratricopeptide repeat protein 1 n=1 Tax=Knufia fluminis TaxID=191047 RepID=A0AAN8EP22_9EURO|nr:hypothetical protein OHC33_003314 [Knufia fluminis]
MDYTFKSSGLKTRPERVKPVPVHPSPSGRSRSSSNASTASFASAVEAQHQIGHNGTQEPEPVRFSPEEETQMVEASHDLKASANKQFAVKDYSSAISTYDKALAELPMYLDYELAVLQSNIAACHLQLKEWKEAIESAERGLDNLEKEMPTPKPKKEKKKDEKSKQANGKNGTEKEADDENKIVELPDDQDEDQTAEMLKNLDISDQRKSDITRIRTKLLLRRARAKVMLCDTPQSAPKPASFLDPDNPTTTAESTQKKKKPGVFENGSQWSNLSTALSDYQTLATPEYFHNLPSSDQKTVIEMLRALPPRVEAAKKAEVDEMMGKLKQLGNGILKPFGLSTDMFKMAQDPNTGGWSMNFDQKAGKS